MRPVPRETLPSFLSRLAASRGVDTPEFAHDLGGAFKRFLRGDPEVVNSLANWAGLRDRDVKEMLSWTGMPIGKVRLQFRGEPVGSRALLNPVVEGCPTCLREDAQGNLSEPLTRMALRGDWQMREVSVCRRHRKLLVPLWTETRPVQRFDAQGQLSRILDRIMAGDMDGDSVELSRFDDWLDDRLSSTTDPTWLAAQATAASASFCRLFGQGLLPHAGSDASIRHRHEAAAAGFSIVEHGPEAIVAHLVASSTGAATVSDPVRQAHGKLIFALESHLLDEPSFDVFRDILREAVLEIWPVAAGEKVLGAVLNGRRLHSVSSAAAEAGIDPVRLRPMLIEAGALTADDPRPDSRAVFDAKGYAQLLANIPSLVTTKAMCALLGTTRVELDALKKAGVLSPRTALAGARRKWLPDDGLSLLEELRKCAVDVSTPVDARDWIAIQSAQARSGVRVADIINGIRSGDIEVRHVQPSAGYHGYQVSAAAISSYGDRIQARESLSGELSLAEFGRSVGIREMERLMALIEAGEIPARHVIHPTTRRPQWRVTKSAVETFRRRFLTPSIVQNEFALSINAARAILRAGSIAPYEPKGRKLGDLYLRDDALPLISRASS
ncbi:TniQ family protein [Paracoccus jeotgali]|nr:TniQ family protein [Paracoccus jeotgali]